MKLQDASWAVAEAQTLSGHLDRRTVVLVRNVQQVCLLAESWPTAAETGGSDNQVFGGVWMGSGALEGENRPILTVVDTSHGCFVLVPQTIIAELPIERIAQTSEGNYPAKFRAMIERILRRANEGRYRDDYPYMGTMAEVFLNTLSAAGKQEAHWTLFYDEAIWDYGFTPHELLDATQPSLEPHKWVLSRIAGSVAMPPSDYTDAGADEWAPERANPMAMTPAALGLDVLPTDDVATTLFSNVATAFILEAVCQVVTIAWTAEASPGAGAGTYGPTLEAIEAAIQTAEATQLIGKASQAARFAYLRAMVYPLTAFEGYPFTVELDTARAERDRAQTSLAIAVAATESLMRSLDAQVEGRS